MKKDPLGTEAWPVKDLAHASLPENGARVRLTADVERFPHFIAPKGATGTVEIQPDLSGELEVYAVRLDKPLEGAEEWANEIHWYPANGDDPAADLEVIEAAS